MWKSVIEFTIKLTTRGAAWTRKYNFRLALDSKRTYVILFSVHCHTWGVVGSSKVPLCSLYWHGECCKVLRGIQKSVISVLRTFVIHFTGLAKQAENQTAYRDLQNVFEFENFVVWNCCATPNEKWFAFWLRCTVRKRKKDISINGILLNLFMGTLLECWVSLIFGGCARVA